MKKLAKKLIGDRRFYAMVLGIALPIMIQNGITNFVSLLDNIMVGQMGTECMSGVSIANQLLFVYQLSVFGACSGAGIFTAQFSGSGNQTGVKHTFQLKLIVCTALALITMVVFSLFSEPLVRLYLHDNGEGLDLERTLAYAQEYLFISMIWLIPNSIAQSYCSTLRETGKTVMPMIAGVAAVAVNAVFNYLLIFGKLGFPQLGVAGAAIATTLSRFVELAICAIWTHKNMEINPFAVGLYRHIRIPAALTRRVFIKGMPLLLNEFFWSMGMAVVTQCYSVRGLNAVAALNICSVMSNVFNSVFMALGNSISIIVGQKLGAGKVEQARDEDTKLIFFSLVSSVAMGGLMALIAPAFCDIYNVSEEVRALSINVIRVAAICAPLHAFANACYFTLRSGGKTGITFLFDSVYVWAVNIPMAFLISRLTSLPVAPMYLICQGVDILKCIVGFVMVKRGYWINNIIEHTETAG